MIMNLRRILGLRTIQDKIAEYCSLKERLKEIDFMGKELTEKFSIQKSVVDDIVHIPENKRQDVIARYNAFLKEHQKEVASIMNERMKILKSIEKFHADKDLGEATKNLDAIDRATIEYKRGRIQKKLYFDIVKSISGEPTKYADVVAVDNYGRILILHRVENFVPTGKVCIPGGHVDPGEDFQTAALRELKEETNLDPIPNMGIKELGEYKNKDAHIKYYLVHVDRQQPVTVDASEHCFSEWIGVDEIPFKPFIFDQGKNVMNFMMKPHEMIAQPLMKALEENRITEEVFKEGIRNIVKKAMDTESEAPLMPESMEGRTKVIVRVRDPNRCMERIMKAISNNNQITIGDDLQLEEPVQIIEVNYKDDPAKNRLTEAEVIFIGNQSDMKNILGKVRIGLFSGAVKVKTPHEEFMSVNENGTDYVGEPIFVNL